MKSNRWRPSSQRSVPVKDFLKDLRVDHGIDLTFRNTFQKLKAGSFVVVVGAGSVHQDIRVD